MAHSSQQQVVWLGSPAAVALGGTINANTPSPANVLAKAHKGLHKISLQEERLAAAPIQRTEHHCCTAGGLVRLTKIPEGSNPDATCIAQARLWMFFLRSSHHDAGYHHQQHHVSRRRPVCQHVWHDEPNERNDESNAPRSLLWHAPTGG